MKSRKEGDQAFLDDIKAACALILANTKHKQLPNFVSDLFFQHAVANLLANIGEAAKNISPATQRHYPTLAWREMARLRDRFVHHYWTIDPIQMWNIIQNDIPQLLETL
jgi:uncharacterized protein with HEPN domain